MQPPPRPKKSLGDFSALSANILPPPLVPGPATTFVFNLPPPPGLTPVPNLFSVQPLSTFTPLPPVPISTLVPIPGLTPVPNLFSTPVNTFTPLLPLIPAPVPITTFTPSVSTLLTKPLPASLRLSSFQTANLQKSMDLSFITDPIRQLLNYNPADSQSILRAQKTIADIAFTIVTEQCDCQASIEALFRIRAYQLDWLKISKYQANIGIFDYHFQWLLGCMVNALLSVNNTFTDLKRVLTRGYADSGTANMLTLNEDLKILYIVKTVKDEKMSSKYEILREALIGLILNQLREFIPTFVFTYGVTACYPAIINSKTDILGWCTKPQDPNLAENFIILEYVDGLEFTKFMFANFLTLADTSKVRIMLSIYLQIVNAIHLANKKYDYTHYDLHSSNVIIQSLNTEVVVDIHLPSGQTMYLQTRYLARIIDYGYSHIKVGDVSIGDLSAQAAGTNLGSSYPISDVYKILLWMAKSEYVRFGTVPEPAEQLKLSLSQAAPSSITGVGGKLHNSALWRLYSKIWTYFNSTMTIEQRLFLPFHVESLDTFFGYQRAQDFYQAPNNLPTSIAHLLTALVTEVYPSYQSIMTSYEGLFTHKPATVSGTALSRPLNDNTFFTERVPNTIEEYSEVYREISRSNVGNDVLEYFNQTPVPDIYDRESLIMTNKYRQILADIQVSHQRIVGPGNPEIRLRTGILDLYKIKEDLQVLYRFIRDCQMLGYRPDDQYNWDMLRADILFKQALLELDGLRVILGSISVELENKYKLLMLHETESLI